MKEQSRLDNEKKSWEIFHLKASTWVQILTALGLIISIFDSCKIREVRIPDLSMENQLSAHIFQKISFINKDNTTAAKFWYTPNEGKNQGFRFKILKGHYVLIRATHDIELSILNSNGDFVSLVSFSDLDWVFQAKSTDDYTIVIGGNNKSEILVDIPPITRKENIMVVE